MSSQSAARFLQERPLRLALKLALRAPHEGPHAIPRKVVWLGLGISEATYSRWLDDAHQQLPDLAEIVAITNITRCPSALAVACRWAGDGYELAPAAGAPALVGRDAHRLLADAVESDAALTSELAEALRDGTVDRQEAARMLAPARQRLAQAQESVELLDRVARGQAIEPLRASS